MKIYSLLSTLFIIILVGVTACFRSGDVRFTATDTKLEYKFSAHYDAGRTRDLRDYLNKSVSPNRIFLGEDNDQKIDTRLQNGTRLKVESSPGDLLITVDKMENDPVSVQRIREICKGVRDVVTD